MYCSSLERNLETTLQVGAYLWHRLELERLPLMCSTSSLIATTMFFTSRWSHVKLFHESESSSRFTCKFCIKNCFAIWWSSQFIDQTSLWRCGFCICTCLLGVKCLDSDVAFLWFRSHVLAHFHHVRKLMFILDYSSQIEMLESAKVLRLSLFTRFG